MDGEGDDDDLEREGSRNEETCAHVCDNADVKEAVAAIARNGCEGESEEECAAARQFGILTKAEHHGLCRSVLNALTPGALKARHLRHVYTGEAGLSGMGAHTEAVRTGMVPALVLRGSGIVLQANE